MDSSKIGAGKGTQSSRHCAHSILNAFNLCSFVYLFGAHLIDVQLVSKWFRLSRITSHWVKMNLDQFIDGKRNLSSQLRHKNPLNTLLANQKCWKNPNSLPEMLKIHFKLTKNALCMENRRQNKSQFCMANRGIKIRPNCL